MADELLKYDLLRLDGGLNEGQKPTHIQDSELAYSRNFYTRGGSLIHRNGINKLVSSGAGAPITGVFLMKTLEDEQRLLVFTADNILKCEDGAFVPLKGYKYGSYAIGDEIDITTGYDQWSLAQYNGYVYAARAGVPKILAVRGDGYHWSRVPSGGFVVGEEYGSGSLPAGDYWCLETFVNDSNQEGNLYNGVDLSETVKNFYKVTITANKAIRWFPTSTYYANQKNVKLYRCYKDSFGTFYHLATLNYRDYRNVGGSPAFGNPFYDNTPDASLGAEYDDARDWPPENIIFLCIWGERLWATDGQHLYCSYPLAPMVFDVDFTFNMGSDEHPMRGMVPFRNVLLVGKTGEVWYMSGSGPSSFAQDQLTKSVGVTSGLSMQATRDYAFWFGGDDFYRFDGSSIVPIGRPRLKDLLDNVPSSHYDTVQSIIVPQYNWYVSSIAQTGTPSRILLVYDYAENKWHVFEYGSQSAYGPPYIAPTYDTDYGRTYHAGFANGYLYEWNTGKTDAGAAIPGVARTKSFGFDTHAMLKFLRDLSIHCPSVADNLTIKLFGDDLSTAIKTRTISLENLDDNWKPVAISNMQHLGTTMALQFEYSGESEFSIDGISFRLVPKQRRRRPL